jgi:hypothetical protein
MSEPASIATTCSLCNKTLKGRDCDWETYKKNIVEYNKYLVGFQCCRCHSSFCLKGHKKELQFNLWSGFSKSSCPRCGTPLQAGRVLLSTAQTKPESVPSLIRESVLFEKTLEKDLAKYQSRAKTLLMIAGFSTVSIIIIPIVIVAGQKSGSTFPVSGGFTMIMSLAVLGVLTWPFWLYHFIKKTGTKKLKAGLPPPGTARLEYAIRSYEHRHWGRLPSEGQGEGKIVLQKKKRFNIFVGLFFMLFGLIGYFIYLGDLKKPGPKIELSLTEEGFVKIV